MQIIINNKLYYITLILQFILLLYIGFCKNNSFEGLCNNSSHYDFVIENIQKIDNLISEVKELKLNIKLNDKTVIEKDITYGNHDCINRIDTVKVSYPGKDGVSVVKYYPLHKTIID